MTDTEKADVTRSTRPSDAATPTPGATTAPAPGTPQAVTWSERSEEIGELVAALAEARKKFGTVKKDKQAGGESSRTGKKKFWKHDSLASIHEATEDHLAERGLTLIGLPGGRFEGTRWVVTFRQVLAHASGQYVSASIEGPLDPTHDAVYHGLGSALSYLERYLTRALLSIASEDDDDAKGANRSAPAGGGGGSAGDDDDPVCPATFKVVGGLRVSEVAAKVASGELPERELDWLADKCKMEDVSTAARAARERLKAKAQGAAADDTTARRLADYQHAVAEVGWDGADAKVHVKTFAFDCFGRDSFADLLDDEFRALLEWISGAGSWPEGYLDSEAFAALDKQTREAVREHAEAAAGGAT